MHLSKIFSYLLVFVTLAILILNSQLEMCLTLPNGKYMQLSFVVWKIFGHRLVTYFLACENAAVVYLIIICTTCA